MTELQKVEFDMLKEVVRICDELHLRYYLVCGSALGAAKYGGFIPWDDDMDIALPREDYEIFIQKAQRLLPDDLFLQNYHTDPSFPQIFSKLRNTKTTFIEKSVAHLPIHHGVYIDIFPLDGYPQEKKEAERLERKKRIYALQLSCVYRPNGVSKAQLLFRIERILGCHKRSASIVKKLETLLAQYPLKESQLWCNHGNWQGALEYAPAQQYGEGTWATFEGMQVRIPQMYDAYLTQKYGDWRADLPENEKVAHHYAQVIDLTRPYMDYMERRFDGKMRVKHPCVD